MITTNVYQMPGPALEKLDRLFLMLCDARSNFERMASSLKNKQIQRTVISLAQESNQYASELVAQIRSLGGEVRKMPDVAAAGGVQAAEEDSWTIQEDEKLMLQTCANREETILKAYREVLNEPFLYEGIRKLIRYQLNGIMHAFSKLKLLNSSLRIE